MTLTLEVMLRGDQQVHTRTIDRPGQPDSWTVADMDALLREFLHAIDDIQNPGGEPRPVELRGLNWIVSPYEGRHVIAFEIPSASAVAGPFDTPAAVLEHLLVKTMAAASPSPTVH